MPVSTNVHAIIYIDDALSLETKNFIENLIECSQQTQRISPFFLQQIKEATDEWLGKETEFKMTVVSEEYYESLRLQDTSIVIA